MQYDIVLIPNKTYAVLRCPNTAAASSVVEYLDGSAALDFLDGQQVHAGFLEAGKCMKHSEEPLEKILDIGLCV